MPIVEQWNISLPLKMAKYIRGKVTAGQYRNVSEVVCEAVRRMQESESEAADVDWLRREVRAGFVDIENGEFTDYDEAGLNDLAQRVKVQGREALKAARRSAKPIQ
jgi:putative addiction module CopG family antidote